MRESRKNMQILEPRTQIYYKVFIDLKFVYCRLVLMFCSRISNNCIIHLHERVLEIVDNDHSSTFEHLLVKDNSVSVNYRNIRLLAVELYKAKNNLSSKIMFELLPRRFSDFSLRSINTSDCRLYSLRYLAPNTWNLAPQDIQSVNSLFQFIGDIKSWILVTVIMFYVAHILFKVGYIN